MSATCTNKVSSDCKYFIQKTIGNLSADLALRFNVEAYSLGCKMMIKNTWSVWLCKNVASVIDAYDFAYHDSCLIPGLIALQPWQFWFPPKTISMIL